LEIAANECEYPLIRHSPGHPGHEDVVVDPVKEFLDVQVYCPLVSLFYLSDPQFLTGAKRRK
jgi:hypothetical protein